MLEFLVVFVVGIELLPAVIDLLLLLLNHLPCGAALKVKLPLQLLKLALHVIEVALR